VCGAGNVELVRALGAARVVNYQSEDVLGTPGRYDAILDNVGNLPTRRLRRLLAPGGILLLNGGGSPGRVFGAVGRFAGGAALGLLVRQRIRPLVAKPDGAALRALAGLLAAGKVAPVLDRVYPYPAATHDRRAPNVPGEPRSTFYQHL